MIDSEGNSSDAIIKNKTNQEARNLELLKRNVAKVREKWAVIIGISKYQDSSLNLKYADRDAEEFYEILSQEKEGFFKKDNIIKLINEQATFQKIRSALTKFLKKPDIDDLFLLYFACHGQNDPDVPDNCYILPYDTDRNEIESTTLPMNDITAWIRIFLKAKKKIIIADACHSGNFGGDIGKRGLQSSEIVTKYLKDLARTIDGTALLTSAEAREVAREGEQWGDGHGVFTHYLIEGMKGEADGYGGRQRDGIISLGELFEYVRQKVKDATDDMQHPLIGPSPYDRTLPLVYIESLKDQKFAELEKRINSQMNEGNYSEVISLSDQAIELDSKNHLSYFYKGQAHEQLKKYDKAIENYEIVIQMKPDYVDAYFRKGIVKTKIEALKIQSTLKVTSESKVDKSSYSKRQDLIETFKSAATMRAIVIGINEYENVDIPILVGAENDVTELNKCLTDSSLGFKIADAHYLRGREATYKNINKAIGELFRIYSDKTTHLILFYFSGHGFVDEVNKEGYIAPYDFDPEDPESCGIRMDRLRNAIFGSGAKANILIVLDFCYAGIATKGMKGNPALAKNIHAENIENPYPLYPDTGTCRLLIASSEATIFTKEKNDCAHPINTAPHAHGAFSYHLIEGLGGGAADNQGLITFESLQKYLEAETLAEGKQRPQYTCLQYTERLDKIIIGKSEKRFREKIEEILRDAKEYSHKPDFRALRMASLGIRELEELDRDNPEIPKLIKNVNDTLENMHARELIENWMNRNRADEFLYVPMMIEKIRPGLYDGTFYYFAQNLSYDVFRNIDNSNFRYLKVLFNEARTNNTYPSKDSPTLRTLINKLKVISEDFRGD